jgi:hypothetical protein|nr:MAG TPA: hypothetical protein [Caudoviricetes sp.]
MERNKKMNKLAEKIDLEVTYDDLIPVWNEYLEDVSYEEQFYDMSEFEELVGDSFQKIFPKLADGFSLYDQGFWFLNGNICSGSESDYYDEVIKCGLNDFADWVSENGYEYKLGLDEED